MGVSPLERTINQLCRTLSVIALSIAVDPAALAAHTHVPIPSTWTLNLKQSDSAVASA